MTKLKQSVIFIILFVASVVLSFYLEGVYQKGVRYFYETLTDYKISFRHPGKYFHFVSYLYVCSFGLFTVVVYYLFRYQTKEQRIKNIVLTMLFFCIMTLLYCFFDGTYKVVACTACDDGTRILNYNDIDYDCIFVESLIFAILPSVITVYKKRKSNNEQVAPTELNNL